MKVKLNLLYPELVIFDMDGLLIDSEPLWNTAEFNVFTKFGVQLLKDEYSKYQGIRVEELVPKFFKQFNIKNIPEQIAVNEVIEEMLKLYETVEILPGVEEIIEYYHKRQIPMAIASSSKQILIDKAIERLHVKNKIQMVHSAEFEKAGKPAPDVFLGTAKKMKTEPDKCLVFEDSIFGVEAAIRAGMPVVAVPMPQNFDNPFYDKANVKVHSLNEFIKQLNN